MAMEGVPNTALSRGVGIFVKAIWLAMGAFCILRLLNPSVFNAWPTARMTIIGLQVPLAVVLLLASVRLWASKKGRSETVERVDQFGRVPIHLMLATALLIVLVDILRVQS
jgi:hypothetical protein